MYVALSLLTLFVFTIIATITNSVIIIIVIILLLSKIYLFFLLIIIIILLSFIIAGRSCEYYPEKLLRG